MQNPFTFPYIYPIASWLPAIPHLFGIFLAIGSFVVVVVGGGGGGGGGGEGGRI